jgi:hypothetical protein
VLVACAEVKPIKAYQGAERAAHEVATLEGEFTREIWSSENIEIAAIDGVDYGGRAYTAKLLPGKHRAAIRRILRGTKSEQLLCSFEFDALAGCTYRPHAPSLSPALARESVFMPMTVRCGNDAYPIRVLTDCERR